MCSLLYGFTSASAMVCRAECLGWSAVKLLGWCSAGFLGQSVSLNYFVCIAGSIWCVLFGLWVSDKRRCGTVSFQLYDLKQQGFIERQELMNKKRPPLSEATLIIYLFLINYCACYSFFYDIVNRGEQLCCKYQLAARLAASLGACVDVKVSDKQLALLLSIL
ncbi:Zinc finger SWIM domain-containing protein 7 [Camellia lanceoleosa]|uniref:Zinc finger SWIM domain-containing protein 7 n=1 Tax=Camellia lanceoleosa TaxID=1840588 RepID=A0ACC0J0T8_9ERIC|nr:Zinc finger SWIM domain-containing protein 7 [Camellia lanceoleosa]